MKIIDDSIKSLPVYSARSKLVECIRQESTVIIVGETGCGKTTQIPKFIHESGISGGKMVAITQPRRVAATSLARRVAEETGTELGQLVGYSVRFEEMSSAKTRIKYMTDGMLMREVLSDHLLKRYSVIVLDEAHERTLRTDILFGLLKSIQKQREGGVSPLKIVIMSATLNAERYSTFFGGAKILYIEGRQYPVDIYCTAEPQTDYLDAALVTIFQIHSDYPLGDILVFLSGQEEIESLERLLNECARELPPTAAKLLVCPLFANLPSHQQAEVFDRTPKNCRKVVLATNLAETSITISGVRFVIDTGVHKCRGYHPRTGIETLTVQPISKASARQRLGRAGRESKGFCFRLYTETAFQQLAEDEEPEIKRCSLSSIVLLLKGAGINDVVGFDYFDRPFRESLLSALEELYTLGALDDGQKLTDIGRKMASFPLEPKFSKALIHGQRLRCTKEVIGVIACLSVESIFFCPHDKRDEAGEAKKKFLNSEGDHLTYLAVLNSYETNAASDKSWCQKNFVLSRAMQQVVNIKNQLERFCVEKSAKDDDNQLADSETQHERVLQALIAGFFMNVALRQPDGTYKTLFTNQTVYIHPSSVLFGKKPDAVMYTDITWTSKCYMRCVSRIDLQWLLRVCPPKMFANVQMLNR